MKKKLDRFNQHCTPNITAKNKSDINQLYRDSKLLRLSVRFVEEHFSEIQPTIGGNIRTKNESIFDEIASNRNYLIAATVSEESTKYQ
jgi:hypothetical protein